MKKVNIQSLSLMMMIAMIYAAVIQTDEPKDEKCRLLQDIQQEVGNMLKNPKWENCTMLVPKIKDTCSKNFFCCAEKSLKGFHNLRNLTRRLSPYNKITKEEGNTNCPLKNGEVALNVVLKEIKFCTSQTLENKTCPLIHKH